MDNLLLNKYKPNTIDEYMLPHYVKDSLHQLIHMEELSFILQGAHGTGKSSILNCIIREYYGDIPLNNINENILYISNFNDQGIGFYRNDMKLFCQSQCTIRKKKKLIIFDDIDQISDQNQHIFRHYIDNYSNRVGFMMSSCHLHKVINSIQSRLYVIELPKPNEKEIIERCHTICQKENIMNVDLPLLRNMMHLTNNTISYIYNYLEKIRLTDEDFNNNKSQLLTHINFSSFDHYFEHLHRLDFYKALDIIKHIHNEGFSVIDILDALFTYLKITSNIDDITKYKVIPLICKYITIFYDTHEDPINLTFLTYNIMRIFEASKV